MSTGAIFLLVTNDGRQDKILTASQFLHQRLLNISQARAEQQLNPIPTLAEIEKTHILFVNAHFKPFVSINYEYNKVTVPGTITLGQKAQFSIPLFGDFFSDMVLHTTLTMSSTTFVAHGSDSTRGTWSDVATDSWRWKWCQYPGERIIQLAEFTVNGNPLDSYTPYKTNIHREFYVPPNKINAWKRCVGQQVIDEGVLLPSTKITSVSTFANYDTVGYEMHGTQFHIDISNGLQTPAYSHDKIVELWIPLLFWFNTDFRLSIPSVAIPYGVRYINITLANANKLVGYAFDFSEEVTDLDDTGELTTTATYLPTGSTVSWANDKFTVTLELYTNNLFVNPEIHEIFIRRIAFNLIRVNKLQENNINTSTGSIWLNSLKWPVETIYIALQQVNVDSSDSTSQYSNLDQWHSFTRNTYKYNVLPLTLSTTASTAVTSASTLASVGIATRPLIRASTIKKEATLVDLGLTVHGVKVYESGPSEFFNIYSPYRFGGPNINAPNDKGLYMMNFCLYPGSYQPSGYINLSRARETYLQYEVSDNVSSDISSSSTYYLKILASAINFLLISDGSAVLRFTT